MLKRALPSTAVLLFASVAVVAHAAPQERPRQSTQQPPTAAQAPSMRVRVPPAFAHVTSESATINGHVATKSSLLAQFDPDKVVTLPSGKTMTTQQLFDGVGRSEDKAIRANTTLRAIPLKRSVMVNAPQRIMTQKQKIAGWKQKAIAAKANGWSGSLLVHPSPGPAAPPGIELTGHTNLPPSRAHNRMLKRVVSPCAFYPGHAPVCTPDFSSIDAPPWSQDVGDPSVVGATTSLSLSGATTNDGDSSSCSLTWDTSVSVFGASMDMLKVSAAESTNARNHSFSGSLAMYIVGNAIAVPDDGTEGGSGSLISESYGIDAGGNFPLIGPIYLTLKLHASATAQIALIGERRLTAGDPTASIPYPSSGGGGGGGNGVSATVNHAPIAGGVTVGIANSQNGTHCHVGVEPTLATDVQLTTGIGFGIDDLIDLMHIEVTGEVKPITAGLPTHVTLDLQRAPPGGQIAFDSHLQASFMQSQLSFDWQIFDVCISTLVGSVCLLHDILQIPTSGSAIIAEDEGFDPLDIDLLGGGQSIKWKPK